MEEDKGNGGPVSGTESQVNFVGKDWAIFINILVPPESTGRSSLCIEAWCLHRDLSIKVLTGHLYGYCIIVFVDRSLYAAHAGIELLSITTPFLHSLGLG